MGGLGWFNSGVKCPVEGGRKGEKKGDREREEREGDSMVEEGVCVGGCWGTGVCKTLPTSTTPEGDAQRGSYRSVPEGERNVAAA